ncbi:beta strand repeat-containing protein, partial [Emticicia aquatilis]|uniref:beta strand repeat-containing protein n=1 Tax=Emticicia aquatilis TaxID=1537369 RepID=UPI00166E3242
MRKILSFTILLIFLSPFIYAQTFTNGLVATGYGSALIYADSDIGPDGKFYVLRNYGTVVNSSNPKTTFFDIRRWDSATSTWTVVGSFDQTDIPNQYIGSSSMYERFALEIDANGNYHVALINYTSTDNGVTIYGNVTYAKSSDGNNWTFTVLENVNTNVYNNYTYFEVQLELDSNNKPHVAYRIKDGTSANFIDRRQYIRYQYYNGTSWTMQTALTAPVSSTANVDINSFAFALDKNNKAHIAASLETNGGVDASLVYLNNVSGTWSSPTTIIAGSTGNNASSSMDIVVDSNVKAHILNRDASFAIKYATNESGSWSVSNFGTGNSIWQSLAINSSNNIFFIYNGQSSGTNTGDVRYAYKAGGASTWDTGSIMAGNNRTATVTMVAELNDSNVAMTWFDHFAGSGSPSYSPDNPRQLQYATASFGVSCISPTVSTNPSNRTICNGNNTTFSVTASNATAYQWQVDIGSGFTDISNTGVYSNATTSTLTITGATSAMNGYVYRCVVINGTSTCSTNSNTATLTVSTIILSQLNKTNVSCIGGTNGTASVNAATGGSAPYTYNWTPGNPTGDGTTSVTGLSAGTWTCTVTDNNGCVATQTFNVTQPALAVSGTTSVTNVSCNGGLNGAINLTPTGGTGSYTYNWGGGVTTEDRTGLAAGNYSVIITDVNGCTGTVTATITQPSAITISPSQVNVSCNGGTNGSASVSVTGGIVGYTYSWSPGGGSTSSITGLSAGTYTCTVTDGNGCTKAQNFTINQPAALSLTTNIQNVTCLGGANGAIDLTVSGGSQPYTYAWTGGVTTQDLSNLSSGNYSVTVTDINLCTATTSVTLTQGATTSVNITGTENLSCLKSSVTRTVSTGISYSWTGPNSYTASTATATINTPGTYMVTMTEAGGCSATATTMVSQDITPPVVNITGTDNITCAQQTVTRSVASGQSYVWTGPNGYTSSNAVAQINISGTYTVTVTGENGCTTTASTVVTQELSSPSNVNVNTSAVCEGTNVTLSATCVLGTVTWYNSSIGGTAIGTGSAFSYNAPVGNNQVFYASCKTTCESGLTASLNSLTVKAKPNVPTITPPTNTVVCSPNTLTLTANCTTGTILWSNNSTSTSLTISAVGTYSISAKCVLNGCESDASSATNLEIKAKPNVPTITPPTNTVVCSPNSLTLTTNCTTGTVLWSNNSTSTSLTISTVGTHSISAKCVLNGCESDASSATNLEIKAKPNVPTITPPSQLVVCSPTSLTLTANCTTGTVLWSNNSTTSSLFLSAVGTYSITAKCVLNGCESDPSSTTNLEIKAKPSVPTITPPTNTVVCSPNTLTLTATCATGTVLWSDNSTTSSLFLSAVGTYSISAKCILNGCESDASTTTSLEIKAKPTVPTITPPTNTVVCSPNTLTLTANCSTGTILWSNNSTSTSLTISAVGTYSISAKCILNGCESNPSSATSLEIKDKPTVPTITPPTNTVVCSPNTLTLTANCSTGTILWSNNSTSTSLTISAVGTYSISAKCVLNGCESDLSSATSLEIKDKPTVPTITPPTNTVVCSPNTLTLTANCTTGTILWSNNSTSTSLTISAVGTYSISAKCVLNGCESNPSSATSLEIKDKPTVPTVTPPTNMVVCSPNSLTLTANCTTGTILWSNNSTSTSLTLSAVGTYSISAKCVLNGCESDPSSATSLEIKDKPTVPTITPPTNTVVCS